jgi:Ca2+-binding RTX toxin-like protein
MALSFTATCSRAGRLLARRPDRSGASRGRKRVSALTAMAVAVALLPTTAMLGTPAQAAPVGQGFNLNASDLRFILQQIKISERHAVTATAANPCGTLLGPGANQIPNSAQGEELPWGLRTVDGTCNNLVSGQEHYGAADNVFPRLSTPTFKDAEPSMFGPPGGPNTSYAQTSGDVFDSRPRTISNLIVDQTPSNPAAVAAAGPEATPDPASGSLPIPNVAPDVGLSAPFNSVFTLFGQFFDHGLDLVGKGGATVYMPLKNDDPLIVGPDGEPGTADDPANPPPPSRRFMVLSRSTNLPGPDGQMGTADDIQEAQNLTTPFVDQNQTYTSHPSQQVFLREYSAAPDGPHATGRLIDGADGGMGTWKDVKDQARDLLGIELSDTDVLNVPLLATDAYGNFERGPSGFPQLVTGSGLVEGDPNAPVSTEDALRTGHAFLDDIAHHAVPMGDRNPSDGPGPVEPLDPDTSAGTADDRIFSTYDDEMLDEHFIAGDGRVNENIGLTSVHHIFHSEHNRLVADIDDLLNTGTAAARNAWHDTSNPGAWEYRERLFQAAKFVTEMEYQHLAFEEFARKVQPMVNAFGEGGTGYDTSLDPAIRAEFAHAVYRFGHSMLTETVARRGAGGNMPLLDAFLNPVAFDDGGQLSPETAAGSVLAGMSRQVGNEIDEFVTGALRSNLLGLPLDLAAINIARARETGVPTLNAARREFYAESNNSALRPYESWVDFGFNLKHQESLVNFVAAYGAHSTITSAGTLRARRAAAARIIAADPTDAQTPADSEAFMNGTGTWSNEADGTTTTGVDEIDLWVGGLAEKQMVFGGLLGSTFNYVFEKQMEDLQFGDRFYYLSRTAGLNLLTQLEGNSFAELIMRNTDAEGLPADVFSRPDYIFNLDRLGSTGTIADDPTTEDYDEGDRTSEPGMHLNRTGAHLRYVGPAHTVFNGTAGPDRLWASEGDDTIRGNDGDDWMQGGDGVDNLVGGLGDDIMNDLFGDDTLKGGDGNDTLSSGQGFGGDLNQGGRGKDFIIGGNDMTETFGGPGNDFVFAGDGEDTVFGDDGNDWIEGGKGPFNLLQGDNGAPFQNDPNQPGHDVLDGDGGEQDFDSEGGDDIMLLGPGIQRAEGMSGFDWAIHKGDPQAGDSDMSFTGLLPPSVGALRDRFDLVEAMSGWNKDDVLRGDSGIPPELLGEIRPEDQVLTQAGINRIAGLADLLPDGATSFTNGNILIGGGGSDTMEGRGGDDIIHGDSWLDVQLQAPNPRTADPNDVQRVDGLRDLRADVQAGLINPGDITIVREIVAGTPGNDLDTAVFSDIRANYDVTEHPDGSMTVEHLALVPPAPEPGEDPDDDAALVSDGTDTLYGIEQLVFDDSVAPGPPTIGQATGGNRSATVRWTAPTQGVVERYMVEVQDAAGNRVGALRPAGAGVRQLLVTGLQNGSTYRFRVLARNGVGDSAFSALSNAVTPQPTPPVAPTMGIAEAGNGRVTVRWTPSDDDGGMPILGFTVRGVDDTGRTFQRQATGTARSLNILNLRNGTTYWFRVVARNEAGTSLESAESVGVTPGTLPSAPRIGTAEARDDAARVSWRAPLNNGGLGINDYRIRVVNPAGRQVGPLRTVNAASTSARVGRLVDGRAYRFQVLAINEMGSSPFSALSNRVVPGTRPGAPVIRRATSGPRGGKLTAVARWAPPRAATLPRLTGYTVIAMRMQSRGSDAAVLRRFRSPVLRPGRRQRRFALPAGIYRFQVVAWNSIGRSQPSKSSRPVRAR